MLELKNTVKLGGFSFDFLHDLEIEQTWDTFTDTARLIIPRNIRFKKNGKILKNIISGDDPVFKRGDSVSFTCGYGEEEAQRFSGLISNILPGAPLVIECQDAMYVLKQTTPKNFSETNVKLETIIKKISPIPFVVNVDFTLGHYIIENVTAADVLDHLRTNYGIISYVRDNILYCGLAYEVKDINKLKVHEIEVEKFVTDDSNLVYQRSDDQKIKIKAISIYPDNTKKEVTVGDLDGGERTQYFYDVPEKDLKTYAEEQLNKFKYTGFAGSFTTFLNPIIKHGDAVKLISKKTPDATGVYLVKRVITYCGVNGGRQVVELDIKI